MANEHITFNEFWENVQNENKGQLVDLWNEYKEHENDYDGKIYRMEELDELLYGKEPTEIMRLCYFGYDENTEGELHARETGGNYHRQEFNPNKNYVRFNGYGNLVSLDDIEIFGNPYYSGRTYLDKYDAECLYNWLIETEQL